MSRWFLLVLVLTVSAVRAFPQAQEDAATAVETPVEALDNPQTSESTDREGYGRTGFATLDALADRVAGWFRPVKKYLDEAVNDKTVSEVAFEARNASVNFATRVSESDVVQTAQDALTPLRDWFVGVRDSVKDKTLAELADDVQKQIVQLDQSVARFINDFGQGDEQQPAAAAAEEVQATPELQAENEVSTDP